ncbi:MAG: hypothetical protein JSV61_08385 [Anaerolineales bacterium]|nr:MAG: hypothetical protein JSV61_08385 [Anaerolineales bacterium]
MTSPVLIATAAISLFGFLSNCLIFYLVVSNRRRFYHYLFAALVLACIIWDLNVFLLIMRNQHVDELNIYGLIGAIPGIFIPVLIYHFTALYVGRIRIWEIAALWLVTLAYIVLVASGVFVPPERIHQYAWGNIFSMVDNPLLSIPMFIGWYIALWPACYFLWRAAQKAPTRLSRRHHYYLLIGFFVISLAIWKVLVTMGIDVPFLLVTGMVLNDLFTAIIGLAIVKDRLLDITVIIKIGAIYSALAGVLIFVFSFTEHILITYFGELIAGHSQVTHFIAVGLGILVLMPVKHRLEGAVDRFFGHRVVEF